MRQRQSSLQADDRNSKYSRGGAFASSETRKLFRGWIYLLVGLLMGILLSTAVTSVQVHSQVVNNHPLAIPSHSEGGTVDIAASKQRLPPSIWTTRHMWDRDASDKTIQQQVRQQLTSEERDRITNLCGSLLYSSIKSGAIQMKPDGSAFVQTGDIASMWTRDSSVQIALYFNRSPVFRSIIEGTLKRNAFYIIQDPYANAYESRWKPPKSWRKRDLVIGRGGWVATRNYELDSGAYFLTQLYDYFVSSNPRTVAHLYLDSVFADAVEILVDMWIVEQHHDTESPYRYFELDNEGKGSPTGFTGMTWTGFRPSDDACVYHYNIPGNIFAAAALERLLVLNDEIWHNDALRRKTTKLLEQISDGIEKYGIVKVEDGTSVYAYEVDGNGKYIKDYDDANVPSLLSIPLLGWSGYDREVYANTRKRLLSEKHKFYFQGPAFTGIGSTHTPTEHVWPMAMAIQGLTTHDVDEIVFQLRQLIKVAECHDRMHESVHVQLGCQRKTRLWFEWANSLFVILAETALDMTCDARGQELIRLEVENPDEKQVSFYKNTFHNDMNNPLYYQGIEAFIQFDESANENKNVIPGTSIVRPETPQRKKAIVPAANSVGSGRMITHIQRSNQ